jgi:hypothetical protein
LTPGILERNQNESKTVVIFDSLARILLLDEIWRELFDGARDAMEKVT